ncbi:MAG: tetratricopeptide repeat protein [Rhodospirillales bacterium]|nr:tetratricopeptide repeat protein [Rhodospirillales bacterium]
MANSKERKKTTAKKGKKKKPKPLADPKALYDGAVSDFQAGRIKQAEIAVARLAQEFPGDPGVMQLQGTIALQSGDAERAAAVFREAVALAPQMPGLCDLLGTALLECGRLEEAETAYRRALNLSVGDAGVFNNLGNVLKKQGRPEDARDAYRESLRLRPGHVATELNLGNVLEDMDDFEEAASAYRRAAVVAPDDPETLRCLGRALLAQGELDQSQAAIVRALDLDPDHPEAREIMGIHHFLRGNLKAAWEIYDVRWRGETERLDAFVQAPWSGEPIKGKTLLVWGEQGIGDEVSFAGMVPDLMAQGANVILECDKRLIPLYERSFPGVDCIPRETPPVPGALNPEIDFQASCGSLGRWLRPDFESFPARKSYLVADEDRRRALRARYLDGSEDFLIGIAWRSVNPRNGRHKSMPVTALAPLMNFPGTRFVNLQYGDTEGEITALEKETGVAIINDADIDQMTDMDGFAAQVAALDLIVSVSNTTVHVAGALGVPAWVMLSKKPMWRWMADRDDSPWYPSLKLFRQSQAGVWGDVIERVGAALPGAFGAKK